MSSKAQKSVLVKEPMPVIEVPDKKIIPVESKDDSSTKPQLKKEESLTAEGDTKSQMDEDVTMNEEIPPNNET